MRALAMVRRSEKSAAAFTLVELLVVIAIIGVLLALILPAVQAAREAGRRISCSNKLHQVGTALQTYHGTHGKFPPGGIEPRTFFNRHGRQLAWSAFLLPYVEEKALHDRINFDKAFDSQENADAAATVLSIYLCPSTPRASNLIQGRAACDYGGINGERIIGNDQPNGTMLYDRPISIKQITDGTTHTLMVSEDAGWPDGQWINGRNIFEVAHPINPPDTPYTRIDNEIRSEHPDGAHGLFCDGSVRFLSEKMDLQALAAICTRSGGELMSQIRSPDPD